MKKNQQTDMEVAKPQVAKPQPPLEEIRPLNRQHKRMVAFLKTLKFKRQLIGGVSEADVWKKISQLDELYNMSLIAERNRYDALLAEMKNNEGSAEEPEDDG